MVKKLYLITALFVPCLAYAADPSASLSVQVVPPQSGPTIPTQAAAQGYTTLALNADFTQGISAYLLRKRCFSRGARL